MMPDANSTTAANATQFLHSKEIYDLYNRAGFVNTPPYANASVSKPSYNHSPSTDN